MFCFALKKLKKPPQKVAYLWQLGGFFLCCPDCPKQPRTSFPFYKFFYPIVSVKVSGWLICKVVQVKSTKYLSRPNLWAKICILLSVLHYIPKVWSYCSCCWRCCNGCSFKKKWIWGSRPTLRSFGINSNLIYSVPSVVELEGAELTYCRFLFIQTISNFQNKIPWICWLIQSSSKDKSTYIYR